jgi:hypothetical protein
MRLGMPGELNPPSRLAACLTTCNAEQHTSCREAVAQVGVHSTCLPLASFKVHALVSRHFHPRPIPTLCAG